MLDKGEAENSEAVLCAVYRNAVLAIHNDDIVIRKAKLCSPFAILKKIGKNLIQFSKIYIKLYEKQA